MFIHKIQLPKSNDIDSSVFGKVFRRRKTPTLLGGVQMHFQVTYVTHCIIFPQHFLKCMHDPILWPAICKWKKNDVYIFNAKRFISSRMSILFENYRLRLQFMLFISCTCEWLLTGWIEASDWDILGFSYAW